MTIHVARPHNDIVSLDVLDETARADDVATEPIRLLVLPRVQVDEKEIDVATRLRHRVVVR